MFIKTFIIMLSFVYHVPNNCYLTQYKCFLFHSRRDETLPDFATRISLSGRRYLLIIPNTFSSFCRRSFFHFDHWQLRHVIKCLLSLQLLCHHRFSLESSFQVCSSFLATQEGDSISVSCTVKFVNSTSVLFAHSVSRVSRI